MIWNNLEQTAPSPPTRARTCCEDLRGCRAGEIASKIPEIFYTFGPLLNTFMSVGILLKVFLSGTVNNALNRFSVFVMYDQKLLQLISQNVLCTPRYHVSQSVVS